MIQVDTAASMCRIQRWMTMITPTEENEGKLESKFAIYCVEWSPILSSCNDYKILESWWCIYRLPSLWSFLIAAASGSRNHVVSE